MLSFHPLSLALCALTVCACSAVADDAGGGSVEDDLAKKSSRKARTVEVDLEACDSYYEAARVIEPGTHLVVRAPNDHVVEELFGMPPELVPGWTVSRRGGSMRLELDVGPDPIELFSGIDRIMTTGPTGSHQCSFDIRAKNVVRQSTFSWLAESGTVDRDLGEVALGGTVLVEASPFGDDPQNQTTLLENEGDAVPTRITRTSVDFGNGTYVFEASEPGEHAFDVRVVIAGYSNHVSHVHWRVAEH